MVPRDLLSRRFVHVDERKLGPGWMLPDLIPPIEREALSKAAGPDRFPFNGLVQA